MTRWSSVLAVVLFGLSIACATARPSTPRSRGAAATLPDTLRVRLIDGSIVRVPLEQYVRGTIISEYAPPAGDTALVERMLEVQAVIARSYAVAFRGRHEREGFDLCSTTHCQLYQPSRLKSSKWAPASEVATKRTAGAVLWFDRAPVQALFHADCGGHISDSSDIWGGPARPYLTASEDDGPAAAAHTAWKFEADAASLTAALNTDPRTRVGDRLQDMRVMQRDGAGRVAMIALRGTREPLVRGEELRAILVRELGPKTIRSTWFTVTRQGTRFVFEGRGYGHGAGLCQAGALARLKAGWAVDRVLARYFPGTSLR